jgi:hypothetical protein
MWMILSTPPNQNDVEPCIQFLINNGMPTDDVKCFNQHNHLKKCMEISFNEVSTTFLALQKLTIYFENSKELLKILKLFFGLPP